MSIIYVALTHASRGGGPKIGIPRIDVAVKVPDESQRSFETALKEATRLYLENHRDAFGVHHFGSYGGRP